MISFFSKGKLCIIAQFDSAWVCCAWEKSLMFNPNYPNIILLATVYGPSYPFISQRICPHHTSPQSQGSEREPPRSHLDIRFEAPQSASAPSEPWGRERAWPRGHAPPDPRIAPGAGWKIVHALGKSSTTNIQYPLRERRRWNVS